MHVAVLVDRGISSIEVPDMSVAQIIQELPKLTTADLIAVRRKLMELADENEEIALCDAMALEGARLLDQMEAEDEG
ncbi:MAG: hypothetical protein J0L73_25100 [Verrucomicrobia bacterium]|nr:hypothetical protein [Verrucomicrobiota bacterium]